MEQHLQDYFVVKILEERKLIYTKILGSVPHEKFKQAMLYVVSLVDKYKLTNWLIDSTASSYTLQDQRWAIEELGLLLQDSTLQRVAMVHNDDLFVELAAENMRFKVYERYGHKQDMEHFESMEQALNWLSLGLHQMLYLPLQRTTITCRKTGFNPFILCYFYYYPV